MTGVKKPAADAPLRESPRAAGASEKNENLCRFDCAFSLDITLCKLDMNNAETDVYIKVVDNSVENVENPVKPKFTNYLQQSDNEY